MNPQGFTKDLQLINNSVIKKNHRTFVYLLAMNQHIQLYSSYMFLFYYYLAIILNWNVISGTSTVNFSLVTHTGLLQSFIPHRPCPCKLKFILSVFIIQSTADKTKSVSCFFLFWWSVTLKCMSQYRRKHLWLYQFLCDFNHFHLFHDLDCPTPRHLNRFDYLNKKIPLLRTLIWRAHVILTLFLHQTWLKRL